ncbi:MAG TPA: SET domain-containing protein [Candidatus Paceibacterota bacterium]|nr:SET domain-containing protein [Candidatus Paceibacterota bacterium]
MKKRSFVPGAFDLRVRRSRAGLGLFTDTLIPKGACIIEYVGRVISKEEEETSKSKYLFTISKNKTIDGKPKWNKAGYINHSCEPNAESEIHKGRIFIMALRAIKPGEEITYDYDEEYCLEHCLPCRCPAKKHLYG